MNSVDSTFRCLKVLLCALAVCFVSACFGDDEKRICPILPNVNWNYHIGVITLTPKPGESLRPIGSGFVFGPNKDVVTCAHVWMSALSAGETNIYFDAQLFNNGPRPLRLKYVLPRFDLAVFTLSPVVEGEPMVVGDFKKMRPGDDIYYYGLDTRYTRDGKIGAMINKATISAVGSALNEGVTIDFLEFEGSGIPGYSGGPVFNGKGELVAVMREAWTKKGIKGGGEILINRAFSLDILSVLDTQVFSGMTGTPPANKSGMSLLDVLDVPKPEIKSNSTPAY